MVHYEMKARPIVLFALLVWVAAGHIAPAQGASFYVVTNGTPEGDGSVVRPWDLQTALQDNTKAANSNSVVKPGDTIWLRGGTFSGSFTSSLNGSNGQPIFVKSFPGEHAILDGYGLSYDATNGVLAILGMWTYFQDLEILDSFVDTGRSNSRPIGVYFHGTYSKCINCIIHDTDHGIFVHSAATNSEVYGCIIYNNGWEDSSNHTDGHGIYAQSNEPKHALHENVLFNQFGYGIHCFAINGQLRGFQIGGNISFGNGINNRERNLKANFLIGGQNVPANGIVFTNNFGYYKPGYGGENLAMGYFTANSDFIAQSNYFGGGYINVYSWTNFIFLNNTIFSTGGNGSDVVEFVPNIGAQSQVWNSNIYFMTLTNSFNVSGTNMSFDDWKTVTGFDSDSSFSTNALTQTISFVRPNLYESNRANIAVFNWALSNNVSVDVSGVLAVGTNYEVRNVQDFFAPAVVTGTYAGGSISLPMTNLSVAVPIGMTNTPAASSESTFPQFNAFILLPQPGTPLEPPTNFHIYK
jgi:hypothetical protein